MQRNGLFAKRTQRLGWKWTCLTAWFVYINIMGASTNTAVTYQGHLTANGIGANGAYDLAFSLYENPAGGSQTGATVTNSSVLVSNGLFTTTLDFGSGVFTGEERWLEIAVRSGPAPFMVLSPRQPLS